MFGVDRNNTSNPPRRAGGTRDGGITILTAGCHFNGKLYCKGATRIGGQVEGQIKAEGLLVIEDEAIINGEIIADEIVIHGQVVGIVEAKKRIELTTTARVTADVTSVQLCIHEGAIFNGRSAMKSAAGSLTRTHEKDSFHPALDMTEQKEDMPARVAKM